MSAESVNGSTPGVRVTWNITVPAECVALVRVKFRLRLKGEVVSTFNTTNVSENEITQTDLKCGTTYYIRVVVDQSENDKGKWKNQRAEEVFVGDMPVPFGVRAEATADNTSIRVSWEWSCWGVPDLVSVHYQPEGGSLMVYTVNNRTATSVTLPNLQCDTKYTIWVYAEGAGGQINRTSSPRMVSLPARAPPTPTKVTAQFTGPSTVRVAWQWTSSDPGPNCFNTTTVTYCPEGGGESSLQLSDPAANETTLTDLQCNTNSTVTVVATAGEHRRESVARTVYIAFLPLQGQQNLSATVLSPNSVNLTWVAPCHTHQYHIYYRGTCGTYVHEGRLDTDRQEYTLDGLQEGVNYSFTVNQTGFSGGRVLSTGPVYARTFTAGAPQLLVVFPMNSVINVSWSEIQCLNGSETVTHYLVQYQSLCGGVVQNVTTNGTVQTVSGLTQNCVYTFQVAAVGAGEKMGPFSNPVNVSLPDDPGVHTTPGVSTSPGIPTAPEVSTAPGVSTSPRVSTAPGASTAPGQTDNLSIMVAGVAMSVIVLVLATVCILVLVIWWRHRRVRGKNAAVELTDMADSDSVDSKEEQDVDMSVDNVCYAQIKLKRGSGKDAVVKESIMVDEGSVDSKEQAEGTSVDNFCYEKLQTSPPTITNCQQEVQCLEGEQVTLMVKAAGIPPPTITWFFKGKKVENDYSTEFRSDGSLMLVSAEMKHAGTYTFTVSNRVGSVEGCTKLVIHTEDEQHANRSTVESNPVTTEKFGEYVSGFHAHNNSAFLVQFQTLPSGEEGHQTIIGKTPANRLLNRFRNITAYDDHRVVLESISDGVDCEHDYINATYIDGYSQDKKYIATQGPLPNTVTDFWWLVWQERVHIVAMVTNTVEKGQQKCEQYWPDEGTKEYGPFKVTLADRQVFGDYTIRQLFMSCDKAGGSPLKVTQFHFTSWPDHGVPEYAGPILNYLCRMKAQMKLSRGPTLVHCSAGVGRTGTLIAIDIALEQAARQNMVDIPAIVTKMRRQRMKMVQTSDQYVFIHDAVLESLTCGDSQILASGLSSAIKKLKEKNRETGRTGFETQFHVLGQVTPKPTEVIRASALRFPDSNRTMDFLPPDLWRVVMKEESKDYIHASFANGYKQRKGFIIAQAPIKSTSRDFWKMVYERECSVIVMLSDLVENGEEVCYQYWPADNTKGVQRYGEFTVSVLQTTKQEDGFIQRNISITNPKSGQEHKVTQFQMSCWTPEGLCTSPPAIMAVIEHVLVIQRRTGNKPIVVHGSDTVSRCGVFCSFINATECCKTEGIVDVFQVVKALRIQKPGGVSTVEQYRFIFDLMLLFLESFNIYSNFK